MPIEVPTPDRIAMSQKERDVLKILHGVLRGERSQAGVISRRYRPGAYSGMETGARDFVAWYLKQLAGPP
jgi:hypothetical protein